MDIDFMKTGGEDQMEMILMQMEKLPDFSGSYADTNGFPVMEFNNHVINHHHHHHNINNDINSYNNTVFQSTAISTAPAFTDLSFSGGAPAPGYVGPAAAAEKQQRGSMAAMREMIFRIAAMQPIHIDPEAVKPPKRRNVRISTDPQSVAARHRRERISERIRILQRLVPGGTKMDTASMLDEAIHYVKFLKNQVQSLERVAARPPPAAAGVGFPVPMAGGGYSPGGGKGHMADA